MKRIILTMTPALLVLLFTYAAISKLIDPADARRAMHNQPLPPEVADVLWILVPVAELTAAGLLLSGKTLRAGLLMSVILMSIFTGYIILVLAGFWDRIPCSCGGVIKSLSWTQHLALNTFFLVLSAAAWLITYKGKAENLRKE